MVLKFARRCREIDRQYEFNNNGELDNGVYHKFVYNSQDGEDSGGDPQEDNQEANNRDLLSVPMLLSERKQARGGRASVENSFEMEASLKVMKEREAITKGIMEKSAITKEMRNNKRVEEIDDELVKTYETFQSRYSNQLDDDKIHKLVSFGYPFDYVKKSLEEYEPNYCTAGYYLLGMDQNYC